MTSPSDMYAECKRIQDFWNPFEIMFLNIKNAVFNGKQVEESSIICVMV